MNLHPLYCCCSASYTLCSQRRLHVYNLYPCVVVVVGDVFCRVAPGPVRVIPYKFYINMFLGTCWFLFFVFDFVTSSCVNRSLALAEEDGRWRCTCSCSGWTSARPLMPDAHLCMCVRCAYIRRGCSTRVVFVARRFVSGVSVNIVSLPSAMSPLACACACACACASVLTCSVASAVASCVDFPCTR